MWFYDGDGGHALHGVGVHSHWDEEVVFDHFCEDLLCVRFVLVIPFTLMQLGNFSRVFAQKIVF